MPKRILVVGIDTSQPINILKTAGYSVDSLEYKVVDEPKRFDLEPQKILERIAGLAEGEYDAVVVADNKGLGILVADSLPSNYRYNKTVIVNKGGVERKDQNAYIQTGVSYFADISDIVCFLQKEIIK